MGTNWQRNAHASVIVAFKTIGERDRYIKDQRFIFSKKVRTAEVPVDPRICSVALTARGMDISNCAGQTKCVDCAQGVT